jgi:hypothetical protein
VSWEYGTLATEIYEQDKPIGHSFGDVEYYRQLLAEAGFAGVTVTADYRDDGRPGPASRIWTFRASRP